MTEPLQQLKNTLKQNHCSLTHSRELVFAALQDKEPQTMHELVLACWRDMDRVTVYRTIELFERLGIVQRLQIGWKYRLELSDTFHYHHHHLTCQVCGQTFALPEDTQLEKRLRELAQTQHFVMRDHQLEIQGICKNCHH